MPTFYQTTFSITEMKRGARPDSHNALHDDITAHASIRVSHPALDAFCIPVQTTALDPSDSDLAPAVLRALAIFAHDLADATKEHLPTSMQPTVEND